MEAIAAVVVEEVAAAAAAVVEEEEEAEEVEMEIVIRIISFLLRLQPTPIKEVSSLKVGADRIQIAINGVGLYSLQVQIPVSRKFPSIPPTANRITRFNGQSIIGAWG